MSSRIPLALDIPPILVRSSRTRDTIRSCLDSFPVSPPTQLLPKISPVLRVFAPAVESFPPFSFPSLPLAQPPGITTPAVLSPEFCAPSGLLPTSPGVTILAEFEGILGPIYLRYSVAQAGPCVFGSSCPSVLRCAVYVPCLLP